MRKMRVFPKSKAVGVVTKRYIVALAFKSKVYIFEFNTKIGAKQFVKEAELMGAKCLAAWGE